MTNEDIVVDPQGWQAPASPGTKPALSVRRIPFELSETDISSDVILLSPAPWAFDFTLETPGGDAIDPGVASGLPAATFVSGNHSTFCRVTLPIPIGATGAREGTWHALLRVDEKRFRKYLNSLKNQPEEFKKVSAPGVRYSLNVYSYSNLKMRARLTQDGNEPGANLILRVVMMEYGLPMTARVDVAAQLTRSDSTTAVLALAKTDPGVFETSIPAT